MAFHFTDLLDASGSNLTHGTPIQGIIIGASNTADFYEVYANVDAGGGGPAATVTIDSATGGPGSFTLEWTTEPAGAPVTVRRSTVLDFGTGSEVLDTGNTSGSHTDGTAPAGKAFYRVETE